MFSLDFMLRLELLRDISERRENCDGLTVIFQTVLIKKALVAKFGSDVPKQDVNG